MCVCIYICLTMGIYIMYVHIDICICILIYMYTYIYNVCTYRYMYTYIYIYTSVCVKVMYPNEARGHDIDPNLGTTRIHFLRSFSFECELRNCSWLESIFKWHRGSSEATQLSHNGFLQHIHRPFHYSWCVFSDRAFNHEEYCCLSSPERALWKERTCAWAAHTTGPVFICIWRKTDVLSSIERRNVS